MLTGQSLTVDHLIRKALGGTDDAQNLWLACRRCNEAKAAQVDAIDPDSASRVPLFSPRSQKWQEHFAWSGDGIRIIGLSAVGRATVAALQMNHPDMVGARQLWVAAGWHPPA